MVPLRNVCVMHQISFLGQLGCCTASRGLHRACASQRTRGRRNCLVGTAVPVRLDVGAAGGVGLAFAQASETSLEWGSHMATRFYPLNCRPLDRIPVGRFTYTISLGQHLPRYLLGCIFSRSPKCTVLRIMPTQQPQKNQVAHQHANPDR